MDSRGLFLLICMSFGGLFAQTKPTLGVLNLNTEGSGFSSVNAGNMARYNIEKLGIYEIIDKQDIKFLLQDSLHRIEHCYGKLCLLEIGKKINADKMFAGAISQLSGKIIVSTRIVDVKSGTIEKSSVLEFEYLQEQLQAMIDMTIRSMLGQQIDSALYKTLTNTQKFESAITVPYAKRLKLNGPRMGFTLFTGSTAQRLAEPLDIGGFNANPVMFQFGYQFETQYLNEGNYQALFEFIPIITGVDQGYFMPSLTILNGLRNNRNGWEIALGPTLGFVNEAQGYFDAGVWTLKSDTTTAKTQWRLDSRGSLKLRTGFVLAIGKTFRSGKLNIPLNAFFIPNQEGMRFGISFGFNARKN